MQNSSISDNFSLLSKLMDIHGENSFKSKTYSIAAYTIDQLQDDLTLIPRENLTGIKGLGKSVADKIEEMLDTGKLETLTQYIEQTPPGVLEMLQIKGIGPKKIHTIWKEMEIESIGELLYACNENRLTRFKGFGAKTQQNVIDNIEFYISNLGHFLYADMETLFPQIAAYLQKIFYPNATQVTGAYRRQEPTVEELEFVVYEELAVIKEKMATAQPPEIVEENEKSILYKLRNGLKLRLYYGKDNFSLKLFRTTGSVAFINAFENAFPDYAMQANESLHDEVYFEKAGLPFIPVCLREKATIITHVQRHGLPVLIQTEDIRSIIHSHSKWSDGNNTLDEMIEECMRRNFEYLVISDHSKTAVYASGLSEERVAAQHEQIDELNKRYAPFKIFKSIESDILNDGALDYPDEILKSFDLVIASVHSNLKMTEEKAMMRLVKAIENPYTRILGHPTGRLLLSRNGYPINHRLIIDACAANNVVIEINANPHRLDMDWFWIDYALEKNVLLSINPDAHDLTGYDDIKYGVLAAQKGGLTKENNLSSFSLSSFQKWLAAK